MTDIATIVPTVAMNNNVQKHIPTYLIVLEPSKGKNVETYFLTNKIEETPSYARATGFFTEEKLETISTNYSELAKAGTHGTEVMFPWGRILCIRNLSYRAKTK